MTMFPIGWQRSMTRYHFEESSKNENARCTGRRSAQRADLKSAAIGRRSATLWARPLGGGVRPNNPKIGSWYDDYNRWICISGMRAYKNGKPPGSTEVRAGGLILPDGVHLAVLL